MHTQELYPSSPARDAIEDFEYMQFALIQARQAADAGEVPIGAVVVDFRGIIVGAGFNAVEKERVQTAHAEFFAITQACKNLNDWRLCGATIYVTIEPCAMCINLILLSRVSRLVFGAKSPIFGYALDNEGPMQVYRRNALEIRGGVCAQEAALIMKNFFKEKRIK